MLGNLSGDLFRVVLVIIGLAIVYLGHELGHLLAAKACRVKLRRYYFTLDNPAEARGYAARPVWQRMIVISAGSLMNLLLAVAFVAVAYRMGVSYTPCILGGTAPGDPAWIHGIGPGDKIVQIGRHDPSAEEQQPDEYLRVDKDLMTAVTLHGADRNIDLLIRRAGQKQAEWISLLPSDRLKELGRPATLGVRPAWTTRLDSVRPCDPDCRDEEGYALLRGGDEIVAVDGVHLPRDETTGAIFEYHLEEHLAARMTAPVTLTVLRRPEGAGVQEPEAPTSRTNELDITLPPNQLRTVGLVMELGPIIGVRRGSPAHKAGFQAGDILLSVDSQPVGDPFTLAQRLLPAVWGEVEFVVERPGADEPVTLRATLAPPATYVDNFGPGSPVALECLGVAFDVGNVVRAVESGSPADMQGLQAGDKVEMVQFSVGGRESGDPIPLVGPGPDGSECDLPNWAHVHTVMNMLTDSTLQLTYRRGFTSGKVILTPQDSDRWFHPSRKLNTTSLTLVRTSNSWLEAGGLGVRDSLLSLRQTLTVLQQIVTGRMSRNSLGGPVMIARSAGSEASHGSARFLLFLAFLSVNLALFNCLPIPPLDGGHIVLLAIEGLRRKPVSRNAQVVVISLSLAIVFFLLRALLVPCLSQLIRSIGLIRRKAPRKIPADA